MYQPQTHLDRITAAQEAPNSNRRKRLLDRQRPFVAPAPKKADPDSQRSIRKEDREFEKNTKALKLKKDQKAAASRHELWSTDPRGRKPLPQDDVDV